MTPKALFFAVAVSLLPVAAAAQSFHSGNPSKAKIEPKAPSAPVPSVSAAAFTPAVTPQVAPTGPVVPLPVVSMKMLSPASGWASNGSQLFMTTDNGAHWKDISPPAADEDTYAAIFFLDAQAGWLLAAQSDNSEDWSFAVWHTSNGGANWTKAAVPAWKHNKRRAEPGLAGHGTIAFADAEHGWLSLDIQGNTLFATSTLLSSSDGGKTWSWEGSGPDAHISGMAAVSGGSLWTVGLAHGASELDLSRNGLAAFDAVTLPTPAEIAPGSVPTYDLPVFSDAHTGYEVVRYRSPDGSTSTAVLLTTSDGGDVWRTDATVSNLLGSEAVNSTIVDSTWVFSLDPHGAPASLVEPRLGMTTSLPAHHSGDFGRCTLSFSTPAQGWSDCSGVLTSTSNGGVTWTAISPRTSNGVLTPDPIAAPTSVPALQTAGVPVSAPSPLARAVSQHLGFDSATLPDPATMETWWQSSPYYDIGIYASGSPNGPTDPALTRAWVLAVSGEGWGILPIWAGLQAPCACNNPPSGPHAHDAYPNCRQFASEFSFRPNEAEQQGKAQAQAAFNSVRSLGLDGTIIYVDIEGYDSSAKEAHDPALSCGVATQAYVAGWVAGMHENGGTGSAGVYGALWDAVPHTHASQPQVIDFQGADSIYIARDDGRVTVWGLDHDTDSNLDDTLWTARQRIHQYRTGADETWGGAELHIDSNIEDAPVAAGNNVKSIVPTTVTPVSYGAGYSYLAGIADGTNNRGLVTGQAVGVAYATDAWDDGVGFLWTTDKAETAGVGKPLSYGTISTVPFAINGLGQVVGYYRNLSTDIGHGFLYTPGKGFTPLDVSGAAWTELYSINDAGWILGGYANADGIAHCALFKPPYTTPVLFDDPGGSCYSTGINGIGQITGAYPANSSETSFVAFVQDPQSNVPGNPVYYQPIFSPSGLTFPQGINNNGIVTGEDANLIAGFFLDPRNSASYATLTVQGTSQSTILGLNDTIQAAGWDYSSTQVQGFLLDTGH
jgi:hypothetical protein